MAGETQRRYAVKELDTESKLQNEGTALEQQSEKTTKECSEHLPSTGTEARASSSGAKVEKLEKERDCTQQREAVIRPQQAGKIDFRSLQNRSKFATDRTWPSGKGSPQSPNGKGRSREKGKRSGKTERGNTQQLYRLSITNPRSNPNIGIAYPQQKVSQPKKLETSRGPVSGNYRSHVPSIPERGAELQQEDLSCSRCFQEPPSNLTSLSYTSQAALGSSSGNSSHPHPPLSQQQPASMETSNAQSGGQLVLDDFHLGGSATWQSPERTFNGANYGVSSQKPTGLADSNKSAFVPGPFQYGYQFLEETTSDSFPCEQNPQTQDFTDSSLGSVHVTHNSFSFTPAEQNMAQNSSQFSNDPQPEERSSYPHPPPSQFIQGTASSSHCSRSLSEDSASNDSSGSGSQHSDQGGKSVLSESTESFGQTDSRDTAVTQRHGSHPKDPTGNQRTLIQGGVHHARNISPASNSQMHFQSKTFNNAPVGSIHAGSGPFDKNINNKVLNRLPHSWEGQNKAYTTADQNAILYTDMNDKFQIQTQPGLDQRSNSSKNSRLTWQQIRPTSAMPSQNRVELSRKISSQKLSYMVSPSDWQDDSKSHKQNSLKSPGPFQNQRQESIKHGSNTVSSFKVEISHAKNKTAYFGLNQSLPVATSRSYNYPPLQVPPMGLMMVAPYESPLPSPVHNPASSSTCSSLSPASTSPVNLSSDDSQLSKAAPPHPFYHPHQSKSQLPSDHLNAQAHQFHSDAPRNLPYAPDKDDMMSYLQNGAHPKTNMDGNKGYMENFVVDHHQPPPPYSAHQLLATATLDQLDVLLTCKQCDQNFNNLASFLGHKQYCAQHAFAQNELKDIHTNISKMEDRKFHAEPAKAVSCGPSVSMSRCPSDLHLSLLGLNKNGELISDNETKGDNKDDPMKLSLFSGPGNLPVPLPDLEMEDAKLDSLITEALNGLSGYQSDNAEIDSSFIDAFADDDLTTVKAVSNKQSLKAKEPLVFGSNNKQEIDDDRSLTQGKYFYDSDVVSPKADKHYAESKLEKMSLSLEQDKKINSKKEVAHKNSRTASSEKSGEQDNKVKEARKLCKREDENTNAPRFLLSSKFSERCGVKGFQDSSAFRGSAVSQASTSPPSRTAVNESKRKRSGGGTWSKELIHKIVQQKNKLHKLHVKGTKNLQFSLVMERLTPTIQNPAFGEYDYVSDSDDECGPVKIASQGRLNQSSRCKYTYTKECKWRARSERDQAAWRHDSKECFEVKKSEEVSLSPDKHTSHQRLRRRGSRSSTSSELSTSVSVSSDSINSPKSLDRTDSDCEKKTDVKKKESRSSPQKPSKESGTLSLTFSKSVKKSNADELSGNKDGAETCHSNVGVADPPPSQKAKDAAKNGEKCQSSPAKSRKRLMSLSKENGFTRSSDRKTEESPRRTNPVPFDPGCPVGDKDGDCNGDRNTKSTRRNGTETPEAREPFEKHSNGVCVEKEAITLVGDLNPESASLCASLMDEVCLSPGESQSPLIRKETPHLMPYPLDQEPGLMKSPLSFDTSSMFGDLAGFDSGLYSDMPMQKESFSSMESTVDKKEEFVSSFSPFLEQRDWSLMVDVSPVLPDEISQYKSNSGKANEKKADYNHVPLSLPEKIIDYSANLNSCASEDELEIKRIVNELENQLQTTKLDSPQLLTHDIPKQLQMSKFSPLRLGDESESEGAALDISCPVPNMDLPGSNMPAEHFAEPSLPWSSPFQFELMSGHHGSHTPSHSQPGPLEHFADKESETADLMTAASHVERSRLQKPEDGNAGEGEGERVESKEDILEQKRYAENLMKSLEVISDSIFKKETIIPPQDGRGVASLDGSVSEAAEGGGHPGEEEAITIKENLSSPPKINERKDDIKFTLNESRLPLSNGADPTARTNHPVLLQPSELVKSNDSKEETKVLSAEEDITENRPLIEFVRCSNMVMRDPHMVEETSEEGNAGGNVDQSLQRNTKGPEHFIPNGHGETEAINDRPDSDAASPTPPEDAGEKMEDVMKTAAGKQSTEIGSNSESRSSLRGGELKPEQSDGEKEEGGEQDGLGLSKSCSPSAATNMTPEVVATNKPHSPILVENNPPPPSQLMEEGSNLFLSHAAVPPESVACTVLPVNHILKPQPSLTFDAIQKEEIMNVKDIKEHLPINFMASHHNSPCREEEEEEEEESHSLFLNTSPPASPVFSASYQTPVEKMEAQEDPCPSQDECKDVSADKRSIQGQRSPSDHSDNITEASSTAAVMDFSLLSPPQLDLGITNFNRKLHDGDTSVPSPPPASATDRSPAASLGLNKKGSPYEFKLSPLTYSAAADEPPPLNQYDYIPISPASKSEEKSRIKTNPGDLCEPCDLNAEPSNIFNKTEPITDSSSLNSDPTDSSSAVEGNDLEICHNSAASVDQLHIQADLLKNLESDDINSRRSPCETNKSLLGKDLSDAAPLPEPLILCEKEQTRLLPEPSEKQPPAESGQRPTIQPVHKEMSPKKTSTQNKPQQGKVLCEICSMCFRTVPGLKRHKAMKHSVKAEKHAVPENTTPRHQGKPIIYEASQTTDKDRKDDSQTSSNVPVSKAAESDSALDETETSAAAVLPQKAKKSNKHRKSKSNEANVKSDPFSDELLNILKTDILQAITPEFINHGHQDRCRSPAGQPKVDTHLEKTVAEEIPQPGCDDASRPAETEMNSFNQTVEFNQITETEEMKCSSIAESNGDACTNNNADSDAAENNTIGERDEPRDETDMFAETDTCGRNGPEENLTEEILSSVSDEIKCENRVPSDDSLLPLACSPVSPPGISPDLKALLDNDSTFSQLFPRDEEAKRKKCPRVYSKRNKRQKLIQSPDASLTQGFPPAETFVHNKNQYLENRAGQTLINNQPNNQCEYETISIDDAIMLNMCHNGALKADAKPLSDVSRSVDEREDAAAKLPELASSLLIPLETTIDKSSIEWSGSSFHADPGLTSNPSTCKAELAAGPCPLTSGPFSVDPCVPDRVSDFHSIDIQNINTTFQLPEIQFFDSNKDIAVAPPIAAVDMEKRDEEKSKKVAERRGRKRQDANIKVKDKQYKCKVCFTWFLTLGELNFHKLSHNPSPPPTCYMCVQRKFSSREQLRDHLREKHAKNKTGIWTCGMCLKEISDVWMYNEHLREHATQFARKGQTQGSMLGIPGCFMQETAVKNFITSIMQHRPNRANRDSSKATKDQVKAAAPDAVAGEGKAAEGPEPKVHKTKSSNGLTVKQSTLTPLEVLHKTETPKSVEMHPNCKDPSRDCHHCGKQFPKPFKLQRHLVVHNLEKIFLCSKCPVSYQEAQELKEHLKREHQELDELDSKHTTLYTCELCADVMHVIKKSFICSTCNYTFSKKEQFDRHMEKHLSGGNKIFKFRGVLRPVRASLSSEDDCDLPASKRRKILSDSLMENSSDSGIASVSSLHQHQTSETHSAKSFVSMADDSTQTTADEYHSSTNNANVKTEDVAEDYSVLFEELEQCAFHMDASDAATPKKEEVDSIPSADIGKQDDGKSADEPCDVKEEDESVSIRAETNQWSNAKESGKVVLEKIKAKEASVEAELNHSEDSFVGLIDNQTISKSPESAKQDLTTSSTEQQQRNLEAGEAGELATRTSSNDSKQQTHVVEQESSSQTKDKVVNKANDHAKSSLTAHNSPVLHSKASLHGSASNDGRESPRAQKKRKETKTPHSLQRVSPPATQENFGVDARAKKKFRPSKCSNPSLQRKSDGPNDYPVLSSVRDDVVSNKNIISKCKTANLSLQTKRTPLDNCASKKAEFAAHVNGAKKGNPGRPLHSPVSKVSAVPMSNPLNKTRPKMGVRSMESHSYRTAESQNHLLSQLFGQKLTSFKIPLRKDTTESIN